MKKILLIGADEALQGAIAEMLAPEEVELLYAENVQTGLAKAQSALPHLVICDLQNPEIDCSTLVCALRQDAKTLLMPLLLLTMPSSLTEARQGMDLGADDYLMKPFEPAALQGAIQGRLRRQESLTVALEQRQGLTQSLQQELAESQRRLKDTQQLEILKSNLLQRIAQDLREPVSNINMALHLLKSAASDGERQRYIRVLESECARELTLLDDVNYLQNLLTPDNAMLLQRFQVLTVS